MVQGLERKRREQEMCYIVCVCVCTGIKLWHHRDLIFVVQQSFIHHLLTCPTINWVASI